MRDAILFLCVANSSRSQMAEAMARELLDVEVFSAGSEPTTVNPFAVRVLTELGIDASGARSKSIGEVPEERIATVVTLCAEEVCPAYLGDAEILHWPFEDPAAARGTDDEVLAVFRRVRDQIAARLPELRTRT